MGFRKLNLISVNMGPIIVYKITKKEKENKLLDVPVGIVLVTSCLQSQHFNTWFIFEFVTCCIIGHNLKASLYVFYRAIQIIFKHFLKTVILWHLS